ncbi:hypothetical protein JCM3770_000545 [Rhodotorula araucariae]
MEATSSLVGLPPPLLDRILAAAILQDPALPTTLLAVSRQIQAAARRILANSLTLPDDHNAVGDRPSSSPDSEGQSGPPPRQVVLLNNVLRYDEWATDVHSLAVVPPVVGPVPNDQDHVPPLEDAALLLVLSRLSSLTSFAWSSYRLPPDGLCLALGQACKNLASFSLDLAASPFAPLAADLAAPGSPQLSTSPAATSGFLLGNGHGTAVPTARWDAPHLSALPLSLARLSLSHLSATGTRALAAALPAFPALEALTLSRTLFVDDVLLAEVGAGAKALRMLIVREMGGTKLSEGGLQALFDGCEALETLELECVEGRFSRACWAKLAPLPSSLRTLRLVYSEQAPHKSWVVDHLASLPAILGADSSSLHTLSITRRPHPAALLPGSHHTARYPIEGVVEPRALGTKAIDALVEREDGGREWRVLELDLFSLDLDGLKRVLEGAPGLQRLQVLFDGPFRSLLSLAPSFAACPALRHLLVSVPPQHTPELAPLTPAEYLAAVPPAAAPAGSTSPPASPPSSPRSGGGGGKEPKEDKHHPLKAIDALLPPTRDWRRFLKKAHSLERIAWTGRGGVGVWTFAPGRAGSSLTRVEFEPTRPGPLAASHVREAEGRGAPASPRAYQYAGGARRRSSTVSSLGALTEDNNTSSSPAHSVASLATSPPPLPLSAQAAAPMSFTAAGHSVSPRKDAPAQLAASPPGTTGAGSGAFGPIGRRRSSVSLGAGGGRAGGGAVSLHAGGALGLAFATPAPAPAPAPVPIGWAGTLPAPSESFGAGGELGAAAVPIDISTRTTRAGGEPAPVVSERNTTGTGTARSFAAAVCGTTNPASSPPRPIPAPAPAPVPAPGPVTAGWAEGPSPSLAKNDGGGRREKEDREGGVPPVPVRRSRGGQGRRRESLK